MSEKSNANRRDFLRGKAAARAFGDLLMSALPDSLGAFEPPQQAPGTHYWLHVTRRAMACQFQVWFNAGQYPYATEAGLEALDTVDRLEAQLSFFRGTSELSRINREAAFRPVEVEPGLFALLETALTVWRDTGGAYDITSAPYWEAWGFARRNGRVPTDDELAAARPFVGGDLVELDTSRRTVRFREPGVRLNLGSIGKGHALDCCARQLEQAGPRDFLIHGGGSSVLARGMQGSVATGADAAPPCWLVGLKHPLRPERRLGEFRLRDRALGTSGTQQQSFFHRGKRYGHIIDPRTGYPAQGMLSTTVLAPTAALADALSTAFYVMDPDAVMEYCRQHSEVATVLALVSRRGAGFELKSANLSSGDLVLLECD